MIPTSLVTASFLEQVCEAESALPLKHPACRSRFLLHPCCTPKVFLFLHGFTAGSYQFEPLGQALFEMGYNVLVPRQPGHGIAGEWSRQCPPPLPTDIRTYQDSVVEWFQIAQSLGERVIVGGLSSGANLAAWLALEYPQQVERSLLFAPYLGSQNPVINGLVKILPIYFEWFNKDALGNFGYKGFRIPALRVFLDLAAELLERAETEQSAPVLVVSSGGDRVTDDQEHWRLFKAILKQQPTSWYYRFAKSLQIRHRMMTAVEGNEYENWVIALAKAYIGSELTWEELRYIADRLLAGERFEASLQTLNSEVQVAPELKPLMEWSITHDRLNCWMPPH